MEPEGSLACPQVTIIRPYCEQFVTILSQINTVNTSQLFLL